MKTLVATAEPPEPRLRLKQAWVTNIMRWNPYKAQWEAVSAVCAWHKSWEEKGDA